MSYTPPTNERGLYLPKRDGDEVDDMNNWPALDAMIEGTHPDVQLYSNVNPPPASGGPDAALGATYTAIEADDGKIWPTPVNCVVTVNTGLPTGFGQGFSGAGVVSFAGTATVTDKRTTGATNPVCSLVNIGTNTYEIWGTKA